jgi:hypothetical protein
MKVTLRPETAVPLFVASTVSGVGSAVPAGPVWLFPPVTVITLPEVVAVSVKVVDEKPVLLAVTV